MQSVINKIMYPHTTLSRIFPPDAVKSLEKAQLTAMAKNGGKP